MAVDCETGVYRIKRRLEELMQKQDVTIVGLAGGSCSGKSKIANFIIANFSGKVLSIDDYYLGIDKMKDDNFDHPDAIQLNLLKEHLKLLKKNESITKPKYDFATHLPDGEEQFSPSKVILLEGLFALNDKIRDLVDLRIYVEASEDKRLERRLRRDVDQRGRSKDSVLKQWHSTVKPMYDKHIEPQRKHADIIINNDLPLCDLE